MITLRWWEWLLNAMIASLVTLLLSTPASAGCNYYPSRSYSYSYAAPTYYTPVVEKKVVAVEYLAVPVLSPAYVVGYAAPAVVATAPAAPAMPASPCSEEVKSLRAELEKLKAALAGGAPPPPQPQNAPGKQSAFATKCAVCHDAAVAATKGGKLELFQNGLALPLKPEVANEAIRQVLAGKMPRNGRLSPEELNAILDEVLTLSAPKK